MGWKLSTIAFLLTVLLLFPALGIKLNLSAIPVQTSFAVGESFSAVCTVSLDGAAADSFNISDVMFRWRYSKSPLDSVVYTALDMSYVRVVNDNTIVLNYPRLTKDLTSHHIECYYQRNGNNEVDSHYLIIGEPPGNPNITSAIVGNWDNLTFTWSGGSATENYYGWYKNSNQVYYTRCDQQKMNSCIVDQPFNKSFNDVLWVKVNASNNYGNVTSPEVEVNLHKIVKPGYVRVTALINYYKADPAVVVVHYQPPQKRSMNYTLEVYCNHKLYVRIERVPIHWDPINDGSLFENVSGLPRYTNCTVRMRARPSQPDGFDGEWSSFNFTTATDVPLAAPSVCSSCFRVIDHSNDTRTVMVYFKPLPTDLARGKVTEYRIIDNITHNKTTFAATDNLQMLTLNSLESDKNYGIKLDARTDVGYNESLHQDKINIPEKNKMLSHPRLDVVVINDSVLLCSWENVANAWRYTLLWCKGSDSHCQGPVNWTILPETVNQHNIVLPANAKDYMVGIAVEDQKYSSGIAWNNCKFNFRSEILHPPDKLSVHKFLGCCDATIRISKPMCDGSKEYGHIVAYTITYHPGNNPGDKQHQTVEAAVGDVFVRLHPLMPEQNYVVQVKSLSPFNKTSSFATIDFTTGSAGLGTGAIVTICIFLFLFLVTLIAALCGIYKYSPKVFMRLRKRFSITILTPQCDAVKVVNSNGVTVREPPYNSTVYDSVLSDPLDSSSTNAVYNSLTTSDSSAPLLQSVPQSNPSRLLPEIDNEHEHIRHLVSRQQDQSPANGGVSFILPRVLDDMTCPLSGRRQSQPVETPTHTVDSSIYPTSSGSQSFGGYAGGNKQYTPKFDPALLPKTEPSAVHMDFSSSVGNSVERLMVTSDAKCNDCLDDHARPRLLPSTCDDILTYNDILPSTKHFVDTDNDVTRSDRDLSKGCCGADSDGIGSYSKSTIFSAN